MGTSYTITWDGDLGYIQIIHLIKRFLGDSQKDSNPQPYHQRNALFVDPEECVSKTTFKNRAKLTQF